MGNLDLVFKIPISTTEIYVLDFHFYDSIGKSEKGFEKLSLRTAALAHACIINKKNTTVHENSFANPFLDFPIEQ